MAQKINAIIRGKLSDVPYEKKTVVIGGNMVGGRNILTQDMLLSEDTKYIIRWSFDLDAKTVIMPAGSALEFNGGSINNGTIVLNSTPVYPSYNMLTSGSHLTVEGNPSMGTYNYTDGTPVWWNGSEWKRGVDLTEEVEQMQEDIKTLQTNLLNFNPSHGTPIVVPVADEEDITVDESTNTYKFKDKTYAPALSSGLGRKYLRKNITQRPNSTLASGSWVSYLVGTYLYLLYWYNGTMYNCHKTGNLGLVIGEGQAAELIANYRVDLLPDYVQENSLEYTITNNLITITLPDETTITGSSIHDVTVYEYLENVDDINLLTQEMISDENTVYIIQYDFTINTNIDVPANCVLEFDGGSISASGNNDIITGNNTGIEAGLVKILDTNVILAGTWSVGEIYVEWFGGKGDNTTDCGAAFEKLNDFAATKNVHDGVRLLKLAQGATYLTSQPIVLENINVDLNSSCIKAISSMDALLTMVTDHTGYSGVKNMGWFRTLSNGTLDANGYAESVLVTDATLLDAYSVVFKNPTVYGIRGSFESGIPGYHRMNNIKIIMDEDKIPNNTTYAIYANVGDSVYSCFEILDFNYAIYESKNTGNTYESVHAWIYQSDITKSVYAHVKYFSVFINPIIDTIKTGFEVAEVFKLHINGGLGMFNATVWNSQMSGEGENNNFQFIKMLSGTIGNANVIARDFVCEGNAVPKIIISNSSNYGLVVLDNCQFYAQTTVDYGKAKRVEVLREYLKQGYDTNNKNANVLVTEGTYVIFDLANWSNIPSALSNKSSAIVTVERTDKVIKQTIRYAYAEVNIIEFKRTGNIDNNTWSNWVFNEQKNAYLYGKDSGTTENRPQITYGTLPGYCYFDTDLGKPIWWYNTAWVDATGATV